jgi:hypothetical protein
MFDYFVVKTPPSLLLSDDYSSLNSAQKKNFMARMEYLEEISRAGFDSANVDDNLLLDCIDNIEVDALAIMSAFSSPETSVTPYSVHSSWTFECNQSDMAKMVVQEAERLLTAPSFSFSMPIKEVRNWIQCWAEALYLTMKKFVNSVSFTEVIVQLIVADALVALFLAFAAMARLNVELHK